MGKERGKGKSKRRQLLLLRHKTLRLRLCWRVSSPLVRSAALRALSTRKPWVVKTECGKSCVWFAI